MNTPLIWLHEEALRLTHPVFRIAPDTAKAIFVWDDNYLRQLNYSLKRLVFIYETLCELPVDIIKGDTCAVIRELAPNTVYIPASNKAHINKTIDALQSIATIKVIEDETFAVIPDSKIFTRFFPYWKIAEQTALQKNAGIHA